MQSALAGDFLSASFDFSFLEEATWDFGSTNELQTLFLDQGLLSDPITVARNCTAIRNFVDAFAGNVDLGPIEFWLNSCADGTVARAADAADINDQLYCTWKEVRL